jgi:hypothetical protein
LRLAETNLEEPIDPKSEEFPALKEYREALKKYEYNEAADHIWRRIQSA